MATTAFLDRFQQAVLASGGKPDPETQGAVLIEEDILKTQMDKAFADYKLGEHPTAVASNDNAPFDSDVAMSFIKAFVRGEKRAPVLQDAGEATRQPSFVQRFKEGHSNTPITTPLLRVHTGALEQAKIISQRPAQLE
jgi:hypothetical protein